MQRDFMWLSMMRLQLIHHPCGGHIPSSDTDCEFLAHLLATIMSVSVHHFLLCMVLLDRFSTISCRSLTGILFVAYYLD